MSFTPRGGSMAPTSSAANPLTPSRVRFHSHAADMHDAHEPRPGPAPQPTPPDQTGGRVNRDQYQSTFENESPNPHYIQQQQHKPNRNSKTQSMNVQHTSSEGTQTSTRSVQMVRDAVVDERSSLNKLFVRHRVSEKGKLLPKWYTKLRVQ